MEIRFTLEEAKQMGLNKLEKKAMKKLKTMYQGLWSKAVVNADIIDDEIVYKVIR